MNIPLLTCMSMVSMFGNAFGVDEAVGLRGTNGHALKTSIDDAIVESNRILLRVSMGENCNDKVKCKGNLICIDVTYCEKTPCMGVCAECDPTADETDNGCYGVTPTCGRTNGPLPFCHCAHDSCRSSQKCGVPSCVADILPSCSEDHDGEWGCGGLFP